MSDEASKRSDSLVADATYLLRALAKGEIKPAGGLDGLKDDVAAINKTAEAHARGTDLAAGEVTELEMALARISASIAPVTVQTLRDTDPSIPTVSWLRVFPTYEAKHLSRGLVTATVVFMFVSAASEYMIRAYGDPLEETEGWINALNLLLQNLTPFTYGAIGACVYLLRSLHTYIYNRTFDRRRGPEYTNRILLGAISGGAIVLLVDQFTTEGGDRIQFSEAALGLLAGYNTDFLIQAIERITAAILPKVTPEGMRRKGEPDRPPELPKPPLPPMSELLDRYAAAQSDEEKKLIRTLIERAAPPP